MGPFSPLDLGGPHSLPTLCSSNCSGWVFLKTRDLAKQFRQTLGFSLGPFVWQILPWRLLGNPFSWGAFKITALHQRSSLTPSKEVMLVASYKKEAMHSAGRSAIQQYIARSLGDHFDPPPPREGRHGLSNSQGGIKAIPQLTGSACPAPLLATASSHTPLPRRCRSS